VNQWLLYWKPDDVDTFDQYANFKIDCVGSKQSRFSKFKQGDIVWIHTIYDSNHLLLGKLILEQKMSREETEIVINRKLVTGGQFPEYWIGEKPWSELGSGIDIRDLIKRMQFEPKNPLPSEYDGRNFQQIRKLCEEDSILVSERWDAYFG